jgi:subtilisin family serine protease
VVAALRAESDRSWRDAGPVIARLRDGGQLGGCERHWIVNSVTCELPTGDPGVLAEIPGVAQVFRVPLPEVFVRAPVGPPDVSHRPEAAPFVPEGAAVYWNLERLGFPTAWRWATGRGVKVVVHDSGFDLDLDAIFGTVWRNPAEIPGNGVDDEGDGYIDDVHGFAFDQGDAHLELVEVRPGRPVHGTVVAATIAGREADGRVLGGAPDVRWMAVSADEIEAPLEWALEHDADVYSMSFSIPDLGEYRANWRLALEHAACAGLFLVTGAGNFGDPRSDGYAEQPVQMRIPEDIPLAVFGVVGIGWNGQRPPFSSQGPVHWDVVGYREGQVDKPDLATVNNDVPALWPDGKVRSGRGNSYSGPHLAAVLALMLEVDPDLTPWRARELLIRTAHDLGEPGFDVAYGHGLVDVPAAVAAAAGEGPP